MLRIHLSLSIFLISTLGFSQNQKEVFADYLYALRAVVDNLPSNKTKPLPTDLNAILEKINRENLSQIESRLVDIWLSEYQSSALHEKVKECAQLRPLEATEKIIIGGKAYSAQNDPKKLSFIPLELLHPDLINATKEYPEIYEELLTLGSYVRSEAEKFFQQQGGNWHDLRELYSRKMDHIYNLAGLDFKKGNTISEIVAAAQIPIFADIFPPKLRFHPDFLIAWEHAAIYSQDLALKLELLSVIDSIGDVRSAPTVGLILEQALYAYKVQFSDPALRNLYLKTLDYFRDHPSEKSAIALSQALAYSKSGEQKQSVILGERFNSPEWVAVLNSTSTNPQAIHLINALRETGQLPE